MVFIHRDVSYQMHRCNVKPRVAAAIPWPMAELAEAAAYLVCGENEQDAQHDAQHLLDLQVRPVEQGGEACQSRGLQPGPHAAQGLVRGRQQLLRLDLVQPQLL